MALLQDFDPPLPKSEDKTNNREQFTHKNCLNIKDKLFLVADLGKALISSLNNFFVGVKNFFVDGRFVPHAIVVTLALIVVITNLSQKIAAAANMMEFVNINPDAEFSVSESVDKYTPLIQNDSDVIQKAILASAVSDGFISNVGTVSTEITDREEPSVLPSNDNKTITYVVVYGDTLSGLGMKFDVKLATLKYVNDIDDADSIKPGIKLKIPPKGYEVPASQIAAREKKLAASRNTVTRSSSSSRATGSTKTVNSTPGSKSNGYPYGWCTYYVATRRFVPANWGNAKNWLSSAKRSGYSTGSQPAVGAIMVTSESGWGHVAFVESVNGGSITVAEMNYVGWGVVSRRTISTGSDFIRGFVY